MRLALIGFAMSLLAVVGVAMSLLAVMWVCISWNLRPRHLHPSFQPPTNILTPD